MIFVITEATLGGRERGQTSREAIRIGLTVLNLGTLVWTIPLARGLSWWRAVTVPRLCSYRTSVSFEIRLE